MSNSQEFSLSIPELHELLEEEGTTPIVKCVVHKDAPAWMVGAERNGKMAFLTRAGSTEPQVISTPKALENTLEILEIVSVMLPVSAPELEPLTEFYNTRYEMIAQAARDTGEHLNALAKKIGATPSRVHTVARGRFRNKSIENHIAQHIGMDADELFPDSVSDFLASGKPLPQAPKSQAKGRTRKSKK